MINDVGKTAVIIRLNDFVINMVNSTVTSDMQGGQTGGIPVLSGNDEMKYLLSVGADSVNSRCLMYTRSFSGDSVDARLRPVLYIPPSVVNTGLETTCIPLYECISPSVARLVNGNYQLTWWTNMDSMTTNSSGSYVYDYSKIHKFKTNSLGDIEDNETAYKVLCTAPIHWDKLKLDRFDDRVYNTPLIMDVAIIAVIQGEGYIVDFSTGGGGGGGNAKMHNHLSNQECGFAGAVFMPSAMPRVMSWK